MERPSVAVCSAKRMRWSSSLSPYFYRATLILGLFRSKRITSVGRDRYVLFPSCYPLPVVFFNATTRPS